jgi:hypothetical protein
MLRLLLLAALLQALLSCSNGFSSPSSSSLLTAATRKSSVNKITLYNTENDNDSSSSSSSAQSLEEKMKSWEATEDEIRAATLGGVIPGGGRKDDANRSDAFDIGLYIAFPIMVIGCLIFAFFPLIVSNIDVSSVGPPPTS